MKHAGSQSRSFARMDFNPGFGNSELTVFGVFGRETGADGQRLLLGQRERVAKKSQRARAGEPTHGRSVEGANEFIAIAGCKTVVLPDLSHWSKW
jgi:hypothetical protein